MDNFLAVNVVGVVDLNYSYVRVGYLTEVLVALLCVENRYGNCNLLDLRRDLREVDDDSLVVAVALAGMDGQARTALVGTPSYGLALTRACWQDSARREAALSLAQKLLGGDGAAMIGAPAYTTALGKSVAQMTASATACAGLLYDLNPEHFDEWSESVVSALMAL